MSPQLAPLLSVLRSLRRNFHVPPLICHLPVALVVLMLLLPSSTMSKDHEPNRKPPAAPGAGTFGEASARLNDREMVFIQRGAVPDLTPQESRQFGARGWVTLFSDDFESSFPGDYWNVLYGGPTAYWGDWTCWYGNSSNESVGCAADGYSQINCGDDYLDNMNSWMVLGPFSLADEGIVDAELNFVFKLNSEPDYDFFSIMASVTGENYYGVGWSGEVEDAYSFDLTDVYTLGNLIGESQVWIAFIFQSDGSVPAANGAQVDDVVLRVNYESNEPPTVEVTSPNGGETLSANASHTITWNANDPDGSPGPLTIDLDYSTNNGGSWNSIATGQSNTGSYSWLLPDVASTQALIRVCANDGEDEQCDESDGVFTIIQNEVPEVPALAPNGGEAWLALSTQAISYTASDPDQSPDPTTVSLDYSTDGGSHWTGIINGLPAVGTHNWTVPDIGSANCLVRARAFDGAAESSDTSDASFEIQQGQNTIGLSDAEGFSGSSVTVELSLQNDNNVKGLQADIQYDASVASFVGISGFDRGAQMSASGEEMSNGVARFLLFYDDDSELLPGTGIVAQLTFALVGTENDQTVLTPNDITISDPDAVELPASGENGSLTIGAAPDPPVIQINALKNPGRGRTIQIFIAVALGSGNSPTVTVGGQAAVLTHLGNSIYLAQHAAPSGTQSVTIVATDTNSNGQSTEEITLNFN